ncbi:hypothetical protein [Mycolicibacterium sediminis]|uniref:Uncharacterized protein n=1 Tax=Mycolicibacterium sediminis TaxID=1286180 RepID=A0A7I7QLV0_9MYCO|nr:hypothetical protein [Mycolicibacterium sediminis]BBY27030.1 hypothetical protein MSEDJ_11260 [Mycolicibacterium sediminis]
MIATRIATAAAILSFGLAGIGGTVVALAAPAHADTVTVTHVDGTPMTGTAGPAVEDAGQITDELEAATRGPNVAAIPAPGGASDEQHVLFPINPAPHGDHAGQGHKGTNENHGH